MVNMSLEYKGDLEVKLTHGPSGTIVHTDAPVDNQGRGRNFSPTDLCSASLASCMMTIMGILAKRENWDLTGTTCSITKEMTPPPRRIARIGLEFTFLTSFAPDNRKKLENAAKTCPVSLSLHPDVVVDLKFNYKE
ncbi:OsmC family protein [bacterium]|nr:OsmC family protein [bacterium]